MTATLPLGLPITSFGPMLRRQAREADLAVKSKEYRASPVGAVVGRYIRAIEYAGLRPSSILSYEQVLAWLAVAHDDFDDIARFCDRGGPDYLEDFLTLKWGRSSENTKAHRYRVLNGFFKWTTVKGLTAHNPMESIRKPRNPRTTRERQAYEVELVHRLIDAQDTLRDRCGVGLLRLALRKNDLRMLRLSEIDLARDVLRLNHAKGGERHRLPIIFADLRSDLSMHLMERGMQTGHGVGDEYLIYPRHNKRRPMDPASIHRWFKRCLERADLPTTIQMHELRHTAGTEMWRETGNLVLAQKLLRHANAGTTQTYLHPTDDDLRDGLRAVEKKWLA